MASLNPLAPISMGVSIGVDLGQRRDPTAICVAEVQRRGHYIGRDGYPKGGVYHFVVRYLQRLPLGTSYIQVAGRLVEIHRNLVRRGHNPIYWVDSTGLGQPVVDLLAEVRLPNVTPVYLTGSDRAVWEGKELRLGKALLVSRLQVLLQSERIHLPKTPESEALIQELLNYEIRVTDSANVVLGALKTGTHDDMATALGLAVWREPKEPYRHGSTRYA